MFTQKYVQKYSLQFILKSQNNENSPDILQWVNGYTKYGAFIQWNTT